MNERLLIWIELVGRGIISTTILFVIVNMMGKGYGALFCIPMILWLLNPALEYKLYGGAENGI